MDGHVSVAFAEANLARTAYTLEELPDDPVRLREHLRAREQVLIVAEPQ
jgi:hypothetical protein